MMEKSATRLAIAFGVNVTFTVQEEPACSELPQVLLEMLKSPGSMPANPKLELVNATEPEPPAATVNA